MRFPLVALVTLAAAGPARAGPLEAGPADGYIVVNVRKAGLLSAFAHDHRFEVGAWRATGLVDNEALGTGSISVSCAAGSLHDTHPGISESDVRKVDEMAAGPDVLDAARYPRIEFRSERIVPAPGADEGKTARGTVHGVLAVRDRSVPVDVPFEVDRSTGAWRIRGTARVKQTALGIRPFNGFGGTVKVEDELEVEFAFTLRPVPAAP